MGDLKINSAMVGQSQGQAQKTAPQFYNQPGKVETIFNSDGSKTEKVYDKHGNLTKESVFRDVNGDGKADLYSITKFYKNNDGLETKTYIDKDGDGYNDEQITKNYDKNDRLKNETRTIEEDINEVKSKPHFAADIHNREMKNLYSGLLMR